MFGIINHLRTILANAIDSVDKWVLKLINAAYDYAHELFQEMRVAVNEVNDALIGFERNITHYANVVNTFAHWIVTKYVPSVISWARRELTKLGNDVVNVVHDLEKWVVRLGNDIVSAVRNITAWAIKHIYDPLDKAFTSAWHWITHEGAFAYALLTHPERLAAILAGYLWKSWLALIRANSKQIARWLLKAMPGMVGELTDAVESFIHDLLA